MKTRIRPTGLGVPVALLITTAACAQTPTLNPRPAVSGDPAPLFDPTQLPGFDGKVRQFTLSLRGDIDGLILSDGTEVKTPPHLSTSIAYAIKPGDAVTIHGLRAAAIPLLQAASITDHTSGRTLIDAGPQPPRPLRMAGADTARLIEEQGAISMTLHGPRGKINGVLLTDGVVLRLPPDAAANIESLLQPGKPIVAQGNELSSPIGKVMEVQSIGPSRANLTPIDTPPPPDPRPPRRDAPPPPPGVRRDSTAEPDVLPASIL